jgi:hypothetical protein
VLRLTGTVLAVALWLAALAPPRAHGGGLGPPEVDLRPPPGMRSRSLRFAWDGQLLKGMAVRQSEYIR